MSKYKKLFCYFNNFSVFFLDFYILKNDDNPHFQAIDTISTFRHLHCASLETVTMAT